MAGFSISPLGWHVLLAATIALQPIALAQEATCPPAPPLPVRGDRPSLVRGDAGPDVQEAQTLLGLLGFHTGPASARFDPAMVEAVQRFQRAVGLNPSGALDRPTWERLLPPLDATLPCLSSGS